MDIASEFIAGGIGGSLGILVGHPFETTKVVLQTGQKGHAKSIAASFEAVNQRGWIRGFFRGLSFPFYSAALINAAYFGVYTRTLAYLGGEPGAGDIALAGLIGGIAQFPISVPIEMTKTTMQSQISVGKGQLVYFKGPVQCITTLMKTGGIKRVYRGGAALAIRDIPTYPVFTGVYELLLPHLRDYFRLSDHMSSFLAGGISGCCTWSLATPADVVKNRIQADPTGQRYKSTWHCVTSLFKEGGFRIFTRGLIIVNIRAFVVSAVTFWSWNYSLRVFEKLRPGK